MEGNGNRMGKTLGIDRDTARRIKRMSTKELDGYLSVGQQIEGDAKSELFFQSLFR